MSFTRKHYQECARIIREHIETHLPMAHTMSRSASVPDVFNAAGHVNAARVIADRLSAMFAADNPRFDPERFAKACEPGGGK